MVLTRTLTVVALIVPVALGWGRQVNANGQWDGPWRGTIICHALGSPHLSPDYTISITAQVRNGQMTLNHVGASTSDHLTGVIQEVGGGAGALLTLRGSHSDHGSAANSYFWGTIIDASPRQSSYAAQGSRGDDACELRLNHTSIEPPQPSTASRPGGQSTFAQTSAGPSAKSASLQPTTGQKQAAITPEPPAKEEGIPGGIVRTISRRSGQQTQLDYELSVRGVLANEQPPSAPRSGASHFPGERLLPREAAGPDELAKILYGNRLTADYPDNCGTATCIVRVVANQTFNDQDGKQNTVFVTAAEPTESNVDHARGAVLGMAWLSHTDKGWVLDLGSPNVITAGTFGKAPDVTIINGGVWAKAVVLQQSDMHQGEGDSYWKLFVPDRERGMFVLGLQLQTVRESSGACPVSPATAPCLKDDFSTKLNLLTEQDGLAVVATISYPTVLHKAVATKTYHVTTANLGNPQSTTTQAPTAPATAAAGGAATPSQPTTGGSETTQAGQQRVVQSTAPATATADAYDDAMTAYQAHNYTEAVRRFALLAKLGDAKAQSQLGFMYGDGQGVARDYAEAVKWYRASAEQGNANAQYNLGVMYENGRGVPLDYGKAIKWYQLAAAQGDASSVNNLKFMFANGQGTLRVLDEAVFENTRRDRWGCKNDGQWRFILPPLPGHLPDGDYCYKITNIFDAGWTTFILEPSVSLEYKPSLMSYHDGFIEGGIMQVLPVPGIEQYDQYDFDHYYMTHTFAWIKVSCAENLIQFSNIKSWEGKQFISKPDTSSSNPQLAQSYHKLCASAVRDNFVSLGQARAAFDMMIGADERTMAQVVAKADSKQAEEAKKQAEQLAEGRDLITRYQQSVPQTLGEIQTALGLLAKFEGAYGNRLSGDCLKGIAYWKKTDEQMASFLDRGNEKGAAAEARAAEATLNNAKLTCFSALPAYCSNVPPDSTLGQECHAVLQ